MKRLLILLGISLTLFGSTSMAASIGDCWLFSSTGSNFTYIYWASWNANYGNILPEAWIQRALLNLKTYCCSSKLLDEKICDEDKKNNIFPAEFPESQYLFDHLIDIMFRRLDAKDSDVNWWNLMYNLTPDPTWLTRRNWITTLANSKDWTSPLLIKEAYTLYRTSKWIVPIAWNNETDYLTSRIKEINSDYPNWSLRSKYERVCDIAVHILYNDTFKNSISKSEYKDRTLSSAFTSCEKIEINRVENEKIYVQSTLLQKGNKLLYDTVRSYLVDYFLKQRLQELEQTIFDLKTFFFDVNKTVTEIVEECS